MAKIEKINLGAEYDERLFSALKEVLSGLGAVGMDSSWGIGGSQELSEWKAAVGDEILEIELETYDGLSISGEAELVRQIGNLVKQKVRAG